MRPTDDVELHPPLIDWTRYRSDASLTGNMTYASAALPMATSAEPRHQLELCAWFDGGEFRRWWWGDNAPKYIDSWDTFTP